ncbi:D-Ala-D-Ala carboxypeptidase family metallohydrolase [Pyruvatibacter mobilis]|uniref:D-Ala-D-Ala carboxypeptidase family metallohydrolase n=1 Tax=Pyruvatibacter mobilis TaxID=1712261 RepID=UPI003BA88E29
MTDITIVPPLAKVPAARLRSAKLALADLRPWDPATTPNFSLDGDPALRCPCCGACHLTQGHMMRLQMFRNARGPVVVTSGYRCPDHPEERGKPHPGAHAQGLATDIRRADTGQGLFRDITLAERLGFTGLGIGRTFLHLDSGHAYAPRAAAWTYY